MLIDAFMVTDVQRGLVISQLEAVKATIWANETANGIRNNVPVTGMGMGIAELKKAWPKCEIKN